MRRDNNRVTVDVVSPSRGLMTRVPSNQPAKMGIKGSFTVASNVRFDDGVVRNAPGFKAVKVFGDLEGTINLIVQDQLTQAGYPPFKSPFIGTSSKIYWISRDVYDAPDVLVYGIPSEEGVSSLSVSTPTAIVLDPTGIPSQEYVSPPTLNLRLTVTSIASAQAFGTLRVGNNISVGGISSAENVPQPTVT